MSEISKIDRVRAVPEQLPKQRDDRQKGGEPKGKPKTGEDQVNISEEARRAYEAEE